VNLLITVSINDTLSSRWLWNAFTHTSCFCDRWN